MTACEQALCDGGKEELPINRKTLLEGKPSTPICWERKENREEKKKKKKGEPHSKRGYKLVWGTQMTLLVTFPIRDITQSQEQINKYKIIAL